MVIFLVSNPGEHHLCAQIPKHEVISTQLADWIVLGADDAVGEARNTTVWKTPPLASKIETTIPLKQESCLSLRRAAALYRKRGFPKSEKQRRFSAALSGQEIVIACTPTRKERDYKIHSCSTPFPIEILRALRIYNATLILRYFQDLDAAVLPVVIGHADILMSFSKQDEELMKVFAVPRPIKYTYETFYTMRNLHSADVSFFAVLLDSREAFCILMFVMLVVWLALSVRDYSYLGVFRLDAVLDSMMFLIASFLANSTTIPADSAEGRRYRSRLSRTSILATWIVAILPLSVYFRGELVSRLAVQVPHDQIDTLEKLELALDRGGIQPCVVADSCMSAVISGIVPYRNQTLLIKLQNAFRLQRSGAANMFNSVDECLNCASKPGFACFSCRITSCGTKKLKQTMVESREPFNVVFATMPATKGYHLARAYDQLLQRLFEAQLGPFSKKFWLCDEDDAIMGTFGGAQGVEEVTQVFELTAFLATLACLMCLSLFVLCVELALGSRRKEMKHAPPVSRPAWSEEATAPRHGGR
ncbi:hypothetical protein MTO96_032973, partial [Rhipicephalus appendiculatus]